MARPAPGKMGYCHPRQQEMALVILGWGTFSVLKTLVRQVSRARHPPVQAYCGDDTASHVGAAFGRSVLSDHSMSAFGY